MSGGDTLSDAHRSAQMIKAGPDLWINPRFVASMAFDHQHYANSPGPTTLLVTMHDGTVYRIRHEPQYLGGTDAYAVQEAICAASEALAEQRP
jgi:hypothetical protein